MCRLLKCPYCRHYQRISRKINRKWQCPNCKNVIIPDEKSIINGSFNEKNNELKNSKSIIKRKRNFQPKVYNKYK